MMLKIMSITRKTSKFYTFNASFRRFIRGFIDSISFVFNATPTSTDLYPNSL